MSVGISVFDGGLCLVVCGSLKSQLCFRARECGRGK